MHLHTFTTSYDGRDLVIRAVPTAEAVSRLGATPVPALWVSRCDSDSYQALMNELGCMFAQVTAWAFRVADTERFRNSVTLRPNPREEAVSNAREALLDAIETLEVATEPLF